MNEKQIASKVNQLLSGGLMDLLSDKIINDIALEIVNSSEMSKREELYLLTKAVKRLNEKLQEYANIYNTTEN